MGSSTDPNNANVARVKFTVRTAGQYKISVLIGANHIAGSPFLRSFIPGPMDARRSRLIRPASTVVCCAGAPTALHIEPRDEYGNTCQFESNMDPVQGHEIDIYDLFGKPNEKYMSAITLTYDKVNARIVLSLNFPEPICLRAIVNYRGQRLPNGDFDIIILSSK